MEVFARVRRAVQVDGMSMRQAAREFGLSRQTIRKMLAYSLPPGCQRKKPVLWPMLGPWLGIIDQILDDDQSQPRKQRHTVKRIWERLKAEHGFRGGYTVVKDYVRQAHLRWMEKWKTNGRFSTFPPPRFHSRKNKKPTRAGFALAHAITLPQGSPFPPPRWSTFTPPLTPSLTHRNIFVVLHLRPALTMCGSLPVTYDANANSVRPARVTTCVLCRGTRYRIDFHLLIMM